VILFGEKYRQAVPVLRALIAAMIPFLLTAPSVSAIVYAMKKPKYIGIFSVFQLITIVTLNWILIPKLGEIGPTIALGVVHVALAIYTWTVVVRHYVFGKS
jgi:O-antigen/teichoic acid export membrane protein